MDHVLEHSLEAVRGMAAERRRIADEVETAGNRAEAAKWRDDAALIDRVLLAAEQTVSKSDHDARVAELLDANSREVGYRRALRHALTSLTSDLNREISDGVYFSGSVHTRLAEARSILAGESLADPYLIWSNVNNAWWRPDSAGYTVHVGAAGRYTQEAAVSICRGTRDGFKADAPPPEVPLREADVFAMMRGPQ